MIKLTKRMHEVLKDADLARGEISNVPLGTAYGLHSRQLITRDWLKGTAQTTAGGSFPVLHGLKLTAAGLRAARTIQGLRADF